MSHKLIKVEKKWLSDKYSLDNSNSYVFLI